MKCLLGVELGKRKVVVNGCKSSHSGERKLGVKASFYSKNKTQSRLQKQSIHYGDARIKTCSVLLEVCPEGEANKNGYKLKMGNGDPQTFAKSSSDSYILYV